MKPSAHFPVLLAISLSLAAFAPSAKGYTIHRSFRNGIPVEAQAAVGVSHSVGAATNVFVLSSRFEKFRHRTWVTAMGQVKEVLEDDPKLPHCQRFVLSDETGRTVLVVNDVSVAKDRLADLTTGDVIAFRGEFVSDGKGGYVHRTHPDAVRRRPGGWLKRLDPSAMKVGNPKGGALKVGAGGK